MEESRPTCPRCTSSLSKNPEAHTRCSLTTCGCVCRDLRVDLSYPDSRLAVAQLCHTALARPLLEETSEEACMVNGVVQDALWALLRDMTGLHEAGPVPDDDSEPKLSGTEVEMLREFLASRDAQQSNPNQLSDDELEGVRDLLHSLPALIERFKSVPLKPKVEARPPGKLQRALAPPPEPEPEEEYPEDPPPPPPRRGQVPSRLLRRGVVPQPMPSPRMMPLVTGDQSVRAQQMGQRRLDNTLESGAGSTGSTQDRGDR